MRICVHQFSIANEAYIGASVTFYTVDGNGAKTSTKATLYDGTTGTGTLSNPQTLDSEGKLSQPAYVDEAVIATVSGLSFTDHDTGIINLALNDRGDWVTATVYAVNDLVNDAAGTGNKYICTERHTSGTFATDRDTNGYWSEFIDLQTVQDWANKTDGAVDGTEYSAKAYALGGTGIDDVAGKGSAKAWATEAEDTTVDGSEFSAKHYSIKASASAVAALAAQTAAEAAAAGIYWKQPVECATTANITLSGEQTIDAVTTSGSRVLVKDQTNAAENGVYVSASGAWARAAPLDTWSEHVGAAIIVTGGTTNGDTAYICTVDAGGTLETTDITWAQFGGGDMKKSDNLSGLANIATARANIGIDGSSENIATGDLDPDAKPYDMGFIAGYTSIFTEDDIAVQTYAKLTVGHAGSFAGEYANLGTAPTGAALILDIEKNGTSIYTTPPQFAAASTTLTAGTLKTDGTEDFVAGDEITFKVTQIGSTVAGSGLTFTPVTVMS